jgi:flagellar hook protein FlgE
MPFRTALSGLNASSAELRVIGNNVANASTTGFKQSRAEFADIFATSNLGVTANAIGTGVRVSSVAQQFTQGNVGFTDNNLDLALSGQGFFILNDNGVNAYSRAGAFGVDRDGYVVNSQQQQLTIFQADSAGNITGAMGPLQLDRSDIAPQATTAVDISANLDASAAVPGGLTPTSNIALVPGGALDTNDSPFTTGTFNLVDQFGNTINNGALRFTYTGAGSAWDAELLVGGASTTPPTTATGVNIGTDTMTLNWDPDGAGQQASLPITVDTSGIVSQTVGAGASSVAGAADGATQQAFDPADASTYNNSTSLTVFDTLGSPHLATMYFRKTGIPNQWETHLYVDGTQRSGPDALEFSNTGSIQTTTFPSTITVPAFDPGGGAASLSLNLDFSNTSQFGSPFSVSALSQDGFATGRLSGIDIGDTGVITSRFTNGQSRTLGQLAIANFNNPQGLRQLGDTSWSETFDSGAPLIGAPGSGSLGLIQSGALEGSNVDLTEELVSMITAQRNFQANAQVITTADTITQTIINIR